MLLQEQLVSAKRMIFRLLIQNLWSHWDWTAEKGREAVDMSSSWTLSHRPGRFASRLPMTWAAFSCTFPNKALLRVGRQERAWQFSETITKEGSVESHEHSQSLGMFQSIPGTRHGRLHAHQHQDRSGANERHSSRALEGSDVCWQAEQQRGAS